MLIINYLIVMFFFLVFFILSTLDKKISYKLKKGIILTSIMLLSFFASFRVIGNDTNSYKLIFEQQNIIHSSKEFIQNIFHYQIEPAFILMISFLKSLNFDYKVFLFISALIPLLIIYKVIIKIEKDYLFITFLLFLMLYLVRGPLDVIRQFFAAVIYLSALYSLSVKKEFNYYKKSILSTFFHYSSLITLFLRPFLKYTWNIKKYILIYTIIFILGLTLKTFIIDFVYNLPINSLNRIYLKLQNYIDNRYDIDSFLKGFLLYSRWFFPIVLNLAIILVLLYSNQIYQKNLFIKLLTNSQIYGSFIFIFLWNIGAPIMARRLEFTLSVGSFFILKEILAHQKGKNKYIYIFIILYLLIYNLLEMLYFIQLTTNIL